MDTYGEVEADLNEEGLVVFWILGNGVRLSEWMIPLLWLKIESKRRSKDLKQGNLWKSDILF
ncbi:hypothetical protein [Streptococcus pyogenes]|uniref:hypothetical protein n=1 Tax=Streptococcus pyogenes TaxID=1314 RepID=UPI0013F63191|nr:hypothetical protein [Streptococcus pyogenes]QIK43906.1 hypothetical protein G7052_07455 [Streptococcus pyogenes]